MKFCHSPRGGRSLIGRVASAALISSTFLSAEVPKGTLNVDRSLVRVGVHSALNWQITYPGDNGVTEVVNVTETGTIIPKKSLKMRVRVLGVAFQSGSTLLPIEASWSMNNSSFTRFFYGTEKAVDAAKVIIDTTVSRNNKINFGARGWNGRAWLPFHSTAVSDKYQVVLKNGDTAPSYAPAYNQGTIKSFLSAYIDGGGRIKIGPRDLIILWECSTATPGTTYFDMQDLVVLVTFE